MMDRINTITSRRRTLGQRIRRRRRLLELTQQELSVAIGTTPRRVGRLEQGTSPLDATEVTDLCDFLSMDIHDLLLGDNSP